LPPPIIKEESEIVEETIVTLLKLSNRLGFSLFVDPAVRAEADFYKRLSVLPTNGLK
jgi:hypothetical protein